MKKIYKIGVITGLSLIAVSSAFLFYSKFGPPTQSQNIFMKTTTKEKEVIARFPYFQILLGGYFAENMHYPDKIYELMNMKPKAIQTGEDIKEMLKDPYTWPAKSLFYYSTNFEHSKCSITSVGNDRLNGTADDITMIFKHGGLGSIECNPKEHPYLHDLIESFQKEINSKILKKKKQ